MKGRGPGVLLLIPFCLFLFLMAHTTRSQNKASSAAPVTSTPSSSAKDAIWREEKRRVRENCAEIDRLRLANGSKRRSAK